MKPPRKQVFIALAFLTLAALQRFWIAPLLKFSRLITRMR